MAMKPLHERFTREQVLHALETTHDSCKDGQCPHEAALNDTDVLYAIAHRILDLSKSSISTGTSTEALAFNEGFHFGMRLAEIEQDSPDPAYMQGQTQKHPENDENFGAGVTHAVAAASKKAIPLRRSPLDDAANDESQTENSSIKEVSASNFYRRKGNVPVAFGDDLD